MEVEEDADDESERDGGNLAMDVKDDEEEAAVAALPVPLHKVDWAMGDPWKLHPEVATVLQALDADGVTDKEQMFNAIYRTLKVFCCCCFGVAASFSVLSCCLSCRLGERGLLSPHTCSPRPPPPPPLPPLPSPDHPNSLFLYFSLSLSLSLCLVVVVAPNRTHWVGTIELLLRSGTTFQRRGCTTMRTTPKPNCTRRRTG
jgi:hypothetical protein